MDRSIKKYRDYYFIAQFEVGQKELADIHEYTYLIDMASMMKQVEPKSMLAIQEVNKSFLPQMMFSTQK